MKLGFHYHICYSTNNFSNYLPTHFGLFIEQLAKNVDELVLFLHKSNSHDEKLYDYKLNIKNCKIVHLSNEKSAYFRFFLGRKIIKKYKSEIEKCDYFLLRGPSPLNHIFSALFPKKRIANLIVGDYKAGSKFLKQPIYRIAAVKILNILMHNAYIQSLKNTKLVFNSEVLFDNYNNLSPDSTIINTTNILKSDIQWIDRPNLLENKIIKLLFVGRIEWAKGLIELIETIKLLNSKCDRKFEMHIVGWDESKDQHIINEFKNLVKKKSVENYFIFHGKKKPGSELYQYYKNSDIFVLPSYQEGFPRTIWEAFANCLPVITTPVGSINRKLTNNIQAVFVEVKNSVDICDAVQKIIENIELHQTLIKNGFEKVKENTIENQVEKLVKYIKS